MSNAYLLSRDFGFEDVRYCTEVQMAEDRLLRRQSHVLASPVRRTKDEGSGTATVNDTVVSLKLNIEPLIRLPFTRLVWSPPEPAVVGPEPPVTSREDCPSNAFRTPPNPLTPLTEFVPELKLSLIHI